MKRIMYIMYILRNGNTNQYKIGITNDLNRRLRELQTGCPGELEIVKLYTHYNKDKIKRYERVLHNYYTKCGCRIRANGEWFELRKPDITFLCQPNGIKEQNKLIESLLKMM